MVDTGNIRVRQVDWQADQQRIMKIREAVFVMEQNVSMEIEMDGLDEQSLFVLAEDEQGNAIGTGRLLPSGKIGRLAVLKPYRGRGVGSAILRTIIEIALQKGIKDLYLHGQTQAKHFYIKHGFSQEGEEFSEAGIPHIKMRFSP